MRGLLRGAAAAALLAGPALAGPILAKDGRFDAEVSARQMSRIEIVGEKIAAVRKLDEPKGPQIAVEADEKSGDVFVAFEGEVEATRSFTVFLTTESGKVVQGVLHPVAADGQTVFVRLEGSPAAAPPAQAARTDAASAAAAPAPRAEGRFAYQETLTQFIRVMFNDQEVDGVSRRPIAGGAMRAGPFGIRQVAAWDAPGAGFHGRVLYLANLDKAAQPVRLDAFLVEHVVACAADHDQLRPGEAGRVFLVEEAP
jgi:hypothetical protein